MLVKALLSVEPAYRKKIVFTATGGKENYKEKRNKYFLSRGITVILIKICHLDLTPSTFLTVLAQRQE